jgi:ubiquinone biosynthesis protein Coq4
MRATLERLAREGVAAGAAAELAAAARAGDVDAAAGLAGLWVHAAASAPHLLVPVYDDTCTGWAGAAPQAPRVAPSGSSAPIPDEFWIAFWDLVTDPATGSDATAITVRTAALSGMVDPAMRHSVAGAALAYPGVADAVAAGWPEPFALAALEDCPPGSIGHALYRLVVDDGFDLEVLDRSTLDLDALPEPLGWLNARILQCHDLWHQLGGYETTVLHEVAISGFQLGQFGHHYSSMFLAVTLATAVARQPLGVPIVVETVVAAYRHGRETPPLLGVPWQEVWHRGVDELRDELGVRPFASPFPAGLVEQLAAAG